MTKLILFIFSFLISVVVFPQERRTIGYDGVLSINNDSLKNTRARLTVSILKGKADGEIMYKEYQKIKTDSAAAYHVEIGSGIRIEGQFDSIIWSDGIFYLKTAIDSLPVKSSTITHNMLMRIPPELSNDYEQGTILSTDHPDYGIWRFPNSRHKRPKLVTIDLTTSYANLAYPANTYPIYRHFEWCDPDGDGIGNSFSISYSDNTNNYFRENTTVMGDVKLYMNPFQEVIVSSANSEITVNITKPIPLTNHSETYAIKGPWKFIYYIEWK